jgi:glucose/arabinose dehydrogenase
MWGFEMRRTIGVTGSLALILALTAGLQAPTRAAVSTVGAVTIATGLDFPTPLSIAPDGRIFYGERFSGEIRIYDPSNGSDTLFFTIPDMSTDGNRGLLGLALGPGYPATPFVYAWATRLINGVDHHHQIVRVTDDGGTGSGMIVIWSSNFPAGASHPGGPIKFGDDGMLYTTAGDASNPANSQNLANDAGKFLRMKRSGAIPPDNPIAGSRIWAYGIRSSFGFDFDPLSGYLWATENGPTCNDEVDRITKGRNYGWGTNRSCSSPPPPPKNTNRSGPDPVMPQVWFTPTIGPTGLAFCVGCGIASAEGAFFFGSYNDSAFRKCTLSADRRKVVSTSIEYIHAAQPLALETGPDNAIYFTDFEGIYKLVEN